MSRRLRVLVHSGCLTLFLTPVAFAQTRPAAGSTDLATGQRIFDAQCAWCHGNGGDGGTGPNLHGKLRHATTLASIVDIITNGIPGTDMPSFRLGLTEREHATGRNLRAVADAYLRCAPDLATPSAARLCINRPAAARATWSKGAAASSAPN